MHAIEVSKFTLVSREQTLAHMTEKGSRLGAQSFSFDVLYLMPASQLVK